MQHLKIFEEFNSTSYDKYLKLAIMDLSNVKRFPLEFFAALVGSVKNLAGEARIEEISDDLVNACKDAIIDVFFDNIEPEWQTEEQWRFWESLSKDSLILKKDENPKQYWGGSPYSDKTVPYVAWKDEVRKTVPKINL